MKLLLYESIEEDGIDQVMMVVPDNYDETMANQEAEDAIGPCRCVVEAEILWSRALHNFSEYRAHVG